MESKQRAPINWLPPRLPNPPWLSAFKFHHDLVDDDDQLDDDDIVDDDDDQLDDDDDHVTPSQTDSLK